MLRVGIISYYPDDEKLRSTRKKMAEKSIQFLKDILPEEVKITVVSQNYGEDDFVEGVQYIKYDDGIGQSKAKNHLLRDFYNSDDDFMLYCDDDQSLYDRYGVRTLLNDLHCNPQYLKDIDCMGGIDGRITPYSRDNEELNVDKNYVFQARHIETEFKILRNVKKYYGEEFYYCEGEYKDLMEDLHFLFTKLSKVRTYLCRNLILRNQGWGDDKSVVVVGSSDKQLDVYNKKREQLWLEVGIIKKPGDRPDYSLLKPRLRFISINIDTKEVSYSKPIKSTTKKLF